jgi:anaerobic ribonucleoside-triphosphate reductase activating protein
MQAETLLNLASWLPRSHANGPGSRMVLWVQGCPFRCQDCQNPENLEFRLNRVMTVRSVWETFQQNPNLDGMSFSGGEPFAQAVALAELAALVRSTGKTVVCWSGYTLSQLQSGRIPGALALIDSIDLLIDGLFIPHLAGNYPLRGSANQELHFLTGKIQPTDLENIPRQEWILNGTHLTYTGFPVDTV